MIKKVFILSLLFLFCLVGSVQAAWLGTWENRIKLTIDETKVDTANQSDFPVMVYLSAASGIGNVDVSCVFDELTADGNRKKIAVTSSDGTTELYVEIERWDDANEKAWLHVKVPSVTHTTDSTLYFYYDVDHADNDTYVGDTNDVVAENVWDNNSKAVYHMADGASTSTIYDSTSNDNDGTKKSANNPTEAAGKIGYGQDCSSDYIKVDYDASLYCGTEMTVSFWVESDITDYSSSGYPVAMWDYVDTNRVWAVLIATIDEWVFYGGVNGAVGSDIQFEVGIDTTMHHIVVVGSNTTKSWSLYVDGEFSKNGSTDNSYTNESSFLTICGLDDDNYFDGILDEVLISSEARSAAWIKASYNSGNDSLITFGSETSKRRPQILIF